MKNVKSRDCETLEKGRPVVWHQVLCTLLLSPYANYDDVCKFANRVVCVCACLCAAIIASRVHFERWSMCYLKRVGRQKRARARCEERKISREVFHRLRHVNISLQRVCTCAMLALASTPW